MLLAECDYSDENHSGRLRKWGFSRRVAANKRLLVYRLLQAAQRTACMLPRIAGYLPNPVAIVFIMVPFESSSLKAQTYAPPRPREYGDSHTTFWPGLLPDRRMSRMSVCRVDKSIEQFGLGQSIG